MKAETISVLENLFRIYCVDINEEGEPKASIIEMIQAWKDAQDLLTKLKQPSSENDKEMITLIEYIQKRIIGDLDDSSAELILTDFKNRK